MQFTPSMGSAQYYIIITKCLCVIADFVLIQSLCIPVADSGIPFGGRRPVGGADLRHGRFSVKMYVKTEELGPMGACTGHVPLDPSMYML